MIFTVAVSCKKDKEILTNTKTDSLTLSHDSTAGLSGKDSLVTSSFKITAQNIAPEKGKALFLQNGKVQFYFDQNENKGSIIIDGKEYELTIFEFTENNYALAGSGIAIEATNGNFKDGKENCIEGFFPEVKVSLKDKSVILTNVVTEDCPNY